MQLPQPVFFQSENLTQPTVQRWINLSAVQQNCPNVLKHIFDPNQGTRRANTNLRRATKLKSDLFEVTVWTVHFVLCKLTCRDRKMSSPTYNNDKPISGKQHCIRLKLLRNVSSKHFSSACIWNNSLNINKNIAIVTDIVAFHLSWYYKKRKHSRYFSMCLA